MRKSLETLFALVVVVAAVSVSGFTLLNTVNVPETPTTWSSPTIILSEYVNISFGGMVLQSVSYDFAIEQSMSQIQFIFVGVDGSGSCHITNRTDEVVFSAVSLGGRIYTSPWTDALVANYTVTIITGPGITGHLIVQTRVRIFPPPA
ncbi:MAG: hypothetical protein JSW61_07255 [Candidatus Thorarchaeota archaeon]|nr:MAG: hypothetical protein JSW61_07255 [Candidatus Thorarchaeota archaeon]